ncbi:MAG: protein kinase [Candidatus Krumholzibacteriia bacterium]
MAKDKNYQILNLVASGGTAVLHKAIQTSLDRVVAIKQLHPHLTEDDNFTRRFILEAKAAASLDHDNIVKIIDFGTEDGTYYMVMEFIEGDSLRDILDRWKQVPVDVALAIVHQVCQGLEHAHGKGIVHRDIKPGNIMLTRAGKVKITDFGLAKLTQSSTQHTAANSILGTPLYMSPEQAYGESVDHRSDLFSLGTMFYEMITGVQPFRDDSYMSVIQNIMNKNAPHPSRFNVEVPQSVQSLLSKAMNKARQARFQKAADFKKAIEQYLGLAQLREATDSLKHLLATDGATVMLPKTVYRQTRKSRLRRGLVAAIAAATLFGAAGFGYTLAPVAVQRQVRQVLTRVVAGDNKGQTTQLSGLDATAVQSTYLPGMILDKLIAAADTTEPAATDSTATSPGSPNPAAAGTTDPPTQPEAGETIGTPDPVATTTTPPLDTTSPSKPADTPKPRPSPRKGWISFKVEPWASIYIDGEYRGDAAPTLRVQLKRGRHSIECRSPKYRSYSETIRITPGELSTRNVILEKLTGHIAISTLAGAQILVDGVGVGVTPLRKSLELDAGDHLVTVKKPGFNVWNNQITVGANETISLNITLSPIY